MLVKRLVMVMAVLTQGPAVACVVSRSSNYTPDELKLIDLLNKSRTFKYQLENGVMDLQPYGFAANIFPCQSEIIARKLIAESELGNNICEYIDYPANELRVILDKVALSKESMPGNENLAFYRFRGGASPWSGLGGLWNGTQVVVLDKWNGSLLVWQFIGEKTAADQMLSYLDEAVYGISKVNRDYWIEDHPKTDCRSFGIVNQDFASFGECYVSATGLDRTSFAQITFSINSAKDETLEIGSIYAISAGSTCGPLLYRVK